MSDHDAVEPTPETPNPHPSRRSVLQAGLFALSAAQLPDLFVSRALAQGTQPSTNNLIGKLEGAEVVTDPAQYPKTLQGGAASWPSWSRPASCRRSQQRIGQDPAGHQAAARDRQVRRHLAAGLHRARSTRSTATARPRTTSCSTSTTPAPRSCRTSRGAGRSAATARPPRCMLRRGMKWSDGEPFTADDFMFWYEDIYQNKELVPTPLARS